MKVVIATHAEKSHLLGMVPLAWALVTAGHEVRVASQPELAPVIAATGLTAVPVGRDHAFWRVLRLTSSFDPLADRVPLFGMAGLPDEEIGWQALKEGYRRVVPWWWQVLNDPMIEDLTAFCRQWRPDLVLWDPTTYAAPIAADAVGALHGRHMWGLDVIARMRGHYVRLRDEQTEQEREDALERWLSSRAAAHGVDFSEDLTRGHFTVDYVPPSLQLDVGASPVRLPMRYVPYNGRSVVPQWLREEPERPRVCLCLGLSPAERAGGYAVSMAEAVDALAGLEVEVVASVAPGLRDELGAVPDNVRVVPFVPLDVLLPTCAAMVNHGGSATVLNTLLYAVPQLVVPRRTFCEPLLAERLAARGAGRALPSEEATGERIREEVRHLLADTRVRHGSARLREEMLAMPGPHEVVRQLEELVTERRAIR